MTLLASSLGSPQPVLLQRSRARRRNIAVEASAAGPQLAPARCLPAASAAAAACGQRSTAPNLQQQPWLHRRQQQQCQQRSGRSSGAHIRRPRLQPCAALPEALGALAASPARDAAAAAFAVFGSVCLIKFFDTLELMGLIDQRLSRKLVHTLAGPGFLACWPLFGSAPYSQAVATLVPALNGVRLLLIGTGVVKDERAVMAVSRTGDPAELLRGPLYYVIVLMAVTLLYWRCSPIGLIVASVMCGGDGLADIVGRRLGKGNPLPWNRDKSWAGSAAMLLGGAAMSAGLIWMFSSLGYFEADWATTLPAVAGISLAASLMESLPINDTIDDNLAVPGVAALLGSLVFRAAALAAVLGLA